MRLLGRRNPGRTPEKNPTSTTITTLSQWDEPAELGGFDQDPDQYGAVNWLPLLTGDSESAVEKAVKKSESWLVRALAPDSLPTSQILPSAVNPCQHWRKNKNPESQDSRGP